MFGLTSCALDKLKARTGVDRLAAYPKILAVSAGIDALDGVAALLASAPYSVPSYYLTDETAAAFPEKAAE